MSGAGGTRNSAVKSAVLKVYELVPEAYRQRFRGCKREDQVYMKYMQEVMRHFDSWYPSSGMNTFEGLRELMLLEQFKASVGGQG